MANLSQAQIEMYARAAGMANPQVMAAIAMAESGGNPNAHNAVPPDNSYGLWQINMIGSMGPARRKEYGITSNEALYNPAINAKAAAKISKGGTSLTPWSTYTSGAYKKYLNGSGGTTAVNASWDPLGPMWDDLLGKPKRGPGSDNWDDDPFGTGIGSDGLSGLGGLTDLAKLGVKAGTWMSNPHNWLNVLYVVVGGVVIIGTLSATVRNQVLNQAKTIAKVAR